MFDKIHCLKQRVSSAQGGADEFLNLPGSYGDEGSQPHE